MSVVALQDFLDCELWEVCHVSQAFPCCFTGRLYTVEEQLQGTCVSQIMTMKRLYKMLLNCSETGQVFMQPRYLYVAVELQETIVG